jgi:hypothetical protein
MQEFPSLRPGFEFQHQSSKAKNNLINAIVNANTITLHRYSAGKKTTHTLSQGHAKNILDEALFSLPFKPTGIPLAQQTAELIFTYSAGDTVSLDILGDSVARLADKNIHFICSSELHKII